MATTYLQYDNLPTWLLTWFYYLQFKVSTYFHVTDQQAFGITLMLVLTAIYLIAVLLIALRVFWKTRGRRAQTIRGDSVLLLGPCDSGKTAFFYAATEDKVPETITSQKENIASFVIPSMDANKTKTESESSRNRGKIIDFPGHPSLRGQLDKYFERTSCIVFMIDGTQYDVKEISEYLYDIFVNSSFVAHPCPLLIAVNKTDLPLCDDNQVVYNKIENELDQIKESRGSIETVGEESVNKLGVEGQKFSFEKDAPCKVYACNCCVKNHDIEKVLGFISASLQ